MTTPFGSVSFRGSPKRCRACKSHETLGLAGSGQITDFLDYAVLKMGQRLVSYGVHRPSQGLVADEGAYVIRQEAALFNDERFPLADFVCIAMVQSIMVERSDE